MNQITSTADILIFSELIYLVNFNNVKLIENFLKQID